MNILKSSKRAEAKPFIPTVEHWAVPGHRKVRNKRYNSRGEFIGYSKPAPVIDTVDVANVKKAVEAAKSMPAPQEFKPFDIATFSPMPGRLLVKRPPPITHVGGIELPAKDQKSQPYFVVVKVGDRVLVCKPGDKVVFSRGHNPKPVRLGAPYHIGSAAAIVGQWEE